MIERIISRGLDAPVKFAPTLEVRKGNARYEEASNDGKVKVRIIHGLTLIIKNSYNYCKSLYPSKQSTTTHAPRGIDW